MTRNEFLAELRKHLQSLAEAEQEEAIRYYEEYFDDAGPENEARVIEELGSPAELARDIIANSTFSIAKTSAQQTEGEAKGRQFKRIGPEVKQKSTGGKALFWALLILSSVIWLPLLFGAVVTVLALLFSVIITVLALVVSCIVLLVGFFLALFLGVPMLVSSPPDGLLLVGMALAYLGAMLLFGSLTILCFKYLVPWCWKQCKRFFRFLKEKCGGMITQ